MRSMLSFNRQTARPAAPSLGLKYEELRLSALSLGPLRPTTRGGRECSFAVHPGGGLTMVLKIPFLLSNPSPRTVERRANCLLTVTFLHILQE